MNRVYIGDLVVITFGIKVISSIINFNINNTNGAFLGEQFSKLGLNCYYHTTVGDNKGRIIESINLASQRSDIVVISGGIGPTADDVTIDAVAEYTGKQVSYNEKEEAKVIEGAILLHNEVGKSCGQIIELD